MDSDVKGMPNGNANIDLQQNPDKRESEKMEVNSIVSNEGTDIVPLQEELSSKMDEPEVMSIAAVELGLPVDSCASTENMETFSGKKDTLDSRDATCCSHSSKNDCNIVESTHDSPATSTVILSEVTHSPPLNQTNDQLDETSLEIAISDPLDGVISEDDDVIIVPPIETSDGAKFPGLHRAVVPYSDSEDSDSSSLSSSSSSDSSDESDQSDSDADCDTEKKTRSDRKNTSAEEKAIKVHGELSIEDLPPIQDLHISVRNDQVVEIGKVLHAVDTLVVVECFKDLPPLDVDSVLFLDRGARPLGRIFDVMGPVTEPLYCVRFNSKEHIEESNIIPGMPVYSAPQTVHSQFVFLKHLMMMKGSDASWKRDREVPMTQLDFSDDEQEEHTRKEQHSNNAVTTVNPDEPSPKSFKASSVHRPNGQGFQGQGCPRGEMRDRFRPRNPWGWSGPRNSNQCQQIPSTQQNQFRSRGPVRPSSFNVDSYQARAPSRGPCSDSELRYPSSTQFGRVSEPGRTFPQLPSNSHDNYDSSWGSASPYEHQGNGYTPSNEHMNCTSAQFTTNQSAEDQRYHAFQSEIARLVDAYSRGAESPMTVPPPSYNPRSASSYGSRPSGPPPQFGTRPNWSGPPPPQQFGSRMRGPPPQFGSRMPGPPPQSNHSMYPGGNQSYENYYSG